MYCNLCVSVNEVVAVVTEVDFTPELQIPVSVKAGYAFDAEGTAVDFTKLVNRNFVKKLVKKFDLGKPKTV